MNEARYLDARINRTVSAGNTELVMRVYAGMQPASFAPGLLGSGEVCRLSILQKLRRIILAARLD